MNQKVSQPQGLIALLLDQNAEFGDRDDAAVDLGEFDEMEVEQALADIACDINADEGLSDSCGQSLAEIWCRQHRLNEKVLVGLNQVALQIAFATIEDKSPILAKSARNLLGSAKRRK